MRARLISGLPADLVGSLTGLTQGHFPVHAEARYADDISPTKAGKKVKKGNAANPIESSATRKGINIYAKAGSPVIAVQDGRIVKIGNDDRLGNFIMLRDAYGNTYTYGRLKKLAHKYPVPKSQTVTPEPGRQGAQALEGPEADRRRRRRARRRPRRRTRRRPADAQAAAGRSPRSACSPTRTARARYKSRRRGPALPQRRRDPRLLEFKSYFSEIYGLEPQRRRAQGR